MCQSAWSICGFGTVFPRMDQNAFSQLREDASGWSRLNALQYVSKDWRLCASFFNSFIFFLSKSDHLQFLIIPVFN